METFYCYFTDPGSVYPRSPFSASETDRFSRWIFPRPCPCSWYRTAKLPEAVRDAAVFRLAIEGERIRAETLVHMAVTHRLTSAYRHAQLFSLESAQPLIIYIYLIFAVDPYQPYFLDKNMLARIKICIV